jgi:hypothetical protein
MKISQLKQLMREVIREVESEFDEPENSIKPHELRKKQFSGTSDVTLSLSLGGINKTNKAALKDFIGMIAYEAGKRQLDIIHAELEQAGKIGMDVDGPEIKSSARNAEKKNDSPLPKGWRKSPPNPGEWNAMSPEERASYLIPGSHKDDWDKATADDMTAAKTRATNDRKSDDTTSDTTTAKKDMGSYNFGRNGTLPKNINLWGDKEWIKWEALPAGEKRTVKFMIPNMKSITWTDNDWKNWEKFNPQGQEKMSYNIPRYRGEEDPVR